MRTIGKLGMALCFVGVLSYGDTWSGKLMDAACYDNRTATADESHESIAKVCAPTASTTEFVMITTAEEVYRTPGRVYKMDSDSNSRITNDIQSGALKRDKDGEMRGMATGSAKDGILNLNSFVVTK